MKELSLFLSKEKSLRWIIVIGAALRLIFVFAGGRIYYGQADYFFQGDTSAWFQAFINLYEHGTFTVNSNVESGKFFRPPGYSFLFGFFYLLSFNNYILAWKLLVAAQVLMDIASIFLVSRIANSIVKSSEPRTGTIFSNCCALLYAVYPFAISWAPVLHAETSSVFFLLLSVYFGFRERTTRNIFLSGLAGGIATLIRLQCIFGVLILGVIMLIQGGKNAAKNFRHAMIFFCALVLSYGLWPARNYFLHDRIMFSQDVHYGGHWSEDFIAFLDFSHSISTDHTPFYWQILKNEKVLWPPKAYLDPLDSVLLDSAVNMARTCGTGFAYWKWGEKITPALVLPAVPCDSAIAEIFTSLNTKQKTQNSMHYWITIPVQNLKKCFFKFSLYGNKPPTVILFSNLLFIFRSCLLVTGLIGIYLGFKNNFLRREFLLFIAGYFTTWYLYFSFFHRNIEIRYLLHTDILLLIPAGYTILTLLFKKYQTAT